MSYLDNTDNLHQDTKQFLSSDYGSYIISTLDEMRSSTLSEAANVTQPNKEWYLARFSMLTEVINLINAPLEDHKSARG